MACHQYDMAPLQPGYYPTGSGQDHTAYYERQNLPYGPREVGLYQGYNMAPRGYVYNQQNARRQNAVKIPGRPRNNNSAASSHNYVDVEKIHEGADVRTTVCFYTFAAFSIFHFPFPSLSHIFTQTKF